MPGYTNASFYLVSKGMYNSPDELKVPVPYIWHMTWTTCARRQDNLSWAQIDAWNPVPALTDTQGKTNSLSFGSQECCRSSDRYHP